MAFFKNEFVNIDSKTENYLKYDGKLFDSYMI